MFGRIVKHDGGSITPWFCFSSAGARVRWRIQKPNYFALKSAGECQRWREMSPSSSITTKRTNPSWWWNSFKRRPVFGKVELELRSKSNQKSMEWLGECCVEKISFLSLQHLEHLWNNSAAETKSQPVIHQVQVGNYAENASSTGVDFSSSTSFPVYRATESPQINMAALTVSSVRFLC